MTPLRRAALVLLALWALVATNPTPASFRAYIREHVNGGAVSQCDGLVCLESRRAFGFVNGALKRVFAGRRRGGGAGALAFESVDCAVLTVVRSMGVRGGSWAFVGVLGMWLPMPEVGFGGRGVLPAVRSLLRGHAVGGFDGIREAVLPDRPWEWLIALFALVGVVWLVFPDRAKCHLTLTWQNVRDKGFWWCMVFTHLSHGGSLLRLCRTIVSVNYLAPLLVERGILTLSGLYGVVLTGSATSTALGMLVLARRYVFASRTVPRAALEINGGGGCVYALLVAACLSPAGCTPFPGGVRPFELLMLNVAFDSFFLAGQKRIADYTAHTGAALGSWLFLSTNHTLR